MSAVIFIDWRPEGAQAIASCQGLAHASPEATSAPLVRGKPNQTKFLAQLALEMGTRKMADPSGKSPSW